MQFHDTSIICILQGFSHHRVFTLSGSLAFPPGTLCSLLAPLTVSNGCYRTQVHFSLFQEGFPDRPHTQSSLLPTFLQQMQGSPRVPAKQELKKWVGKRILEKFDIHHFPQKSIKVVILGGNSELRWIFLYLFYCFFITL